METSKEKESHLCKMLIIGNGQSGKSNLILRYADNTYTGSFISTLGVDFKTKSLQLRNSLVKNQIWEESRNTNFRNHKQYIGADAIIVTVDMTDANALTYLQKYIQEIQRYAKEKVVVVVAATKMDKEEDFKVEKNDLIEFCTQLNHDLRFVSAKTGAGVEELFECASKKFIEVKQGSFTQSTMKERLNEGREVSATQAEMKALITRIQDISTNYGYWQGKVRTGYGAGLDNQKVPANVANFLVILGNPKSSNEEILNNIGKIADKAHSPNFQWAHSLFRGRDEKTNTLYGVLGKLSQDNGKISKKVMDEVTKELDKEFPSNPVSNNKMKI